MVLYLRRDKNEEDLQDVDAESQAAATENVETNNPVESEDIIVVESAEDLPTEYLLEVPFTSQAPDANWDQPYQDACEEAAVLVVHYYYEKKEFIPELADEEILALVEFENAYFGDYVDTTAAETAEMVKEHWGYNRVEVIDDPSVEDIKMHIVANRPVVVPVAGQMLANPFFTGEGPEYHMLTITGYTATTFITNDVGTRRGEDYEYETNVLMNAIHDYDAVDIEQGEARVIVIWPDL